MKDLYLRHRERVLLHEITPWPITSLPQSILRLDIHWHTESLILFEYSLDLPDLLINFFFNSFLLFYIFLMCSHPFMNYCPWVMIYCPWDLRVLRHPRVLLRIIIRVGFLFTTHIIFLTCFLTFQPFTLIQLLLYILTIRYGLRVDYIILRVDYIIKKILD